MIVIGDKLKLYFNPLIGGCIARDSLGFLKNVSIEVARKSDFYPQPDYWQAYKYSQPTITERSNYVQSRGLLAKLTGETIPVSYSIETQVDGFDVHIMFDVTFQSNFDDVSIVKTWCSYNATSVRIDDWHSNVVYDLTGCEKWTEVLKYMEDKPIKEMEFERKNCIVTLRATDVTPYMLEFIWKHPRKAEYILEWFRRKYALDTVITKGTHFHCEWKLNYQVKK